MERFKLKTCLLSDEDLRVLMESLWHSIQRGDISDEDRERAHKLREQFKERFHAKDEHDPQPVEPEDPGAPGETWG